MHHSKNLYEKGIIKNLKMLTQTQYSNFKFVARLDHIKTFHAAVKALYFGETALFQISDDGLRVTVESGKSIQASLFITPTCFAEYYVDGIINFGLNINVLIECLGALNGIDCSIKMFYKGNGAPLLIVMEPQEDNNVTTECAIKTSVYDEPIDFGLDEDCAKLNTVFIRGPDLANIFYELDKSSVELEITLSPHSPFFKIDTLGVMQSQASVQVSKTSDMMLLFNCRDTTTARYKNSQMRMTGKALNVANKVAIKSDASGLLELQFMLQSDDDSEIYIQFFLTPVVVE